MVLFDYTCTTALASTEPRSDGSYDFSGLPPVIYCVELNPAVMLWEVVTVAAGGTGTVNFGVPSSASPLPPPPPPTSVSFFAFVYEGCDPGAPFSVGTLVEIADSYGTVYSIYTDAEGAAGFSSAAPGRYTITIPGRNFFSGAPASNTFDVILSTGVTFQLAP